MFAEVHDKNKIPTKLTGHEIFPYKVTVKI